MAAIVAPELFQRQRRLQLRRFSAGPTRPSGPVKEPEGHTTVHQEAKPTLAQRKCQMSHEQKSYLQHLTTFLEMLGVNQVSLKIITSKQSHRALAAIGGTTAGGGQFLIL